MKTSLKLIALLLAAGFPCVVFAEFAGAPVPASINAESAVGLFATVFIGLLFLSDYSRRSRTLDVSHVIVPDASAFTTRTVRLAA